MFSGLIGRFVFDILKIPSGCRPASKTGTRKLLRFGNNNNNKKYYDCLLTSLCKYETLYRSLSPKCLWSNANCKWGVEWQFHWPVSGSPWWLARWSSTTHTHCRIECPLMVSIHLLNVPLHFVQSLRYMSWRASKSDSHRTVCSYTSFETLVYWKNNPPKLYVPFKAVWWL